MNKIKGKQVAVARVVYKEGKPTLQHGKISMLIDSIEKEKQGLKDSYFEDCLKQLEKLGDFQKISNELNGGQGNEVAHPGLALRCKGDPRLVCVVDIGSNWQKDSDAQSAEATECDLVLKFFLDVYNEEGKDLVPEYPFPEEALHYIDNLRKEESIQPVRQLLTEKMSSSVKDKDVEDLSKLFESTINETGEADQDYDHSFYDDVCKAISKLGFKCSHKEFDKYQGVYFLVSTKDDKPVTKLWTVDSYVVGSLDKKNLPKYVKAQLVGPQGDTYSADKGDYDFSMGKDHVFDGYDLLLVKQNGKSETIHNPKVKDLPDGKDVGFGQYVGKPDDVLVVEPEGKEGDQAEIRISSKGKVDLGNLPKILKKLSKEKTKEMAMEHNMFGVDQVDSFGLPKLDEEKDLAAKLDGQEDPNKAGEAIAKPESELKGDNKAVTQGDLDAKAVKVGDPGDDHGDHVEGGSKQSDDQQKDLAQSEVKLGKPGDDHGKHVAESKVKTDAERRLAEGQAHRDAVKVRIEEARKRALKRFEEEAKKSEKKINESLAAEDAEKVKDMADMTKENADKGEMDHEIKKMKESLAAKLSEAEDLKKLIQAKECSMAETKAKEDAEKAASEKKADMGEDKDSEEKKVEEAKKKYDEALAHYEAAKKAMEAKATKPMGEKKDDEEKKPEAEKKPEEAKQMGNDKPEGHKYEAKAMPAAIRSKLKELMKKKHDHHA